MATLVIAAGLACTGRGTDPALGEIPAVALEGLEAGVREHIVQVREALDATLASPQAEPAVLGQSFGEMGKVYHCYELVDAAAVCYTNASRLLPREHCWVYYLGRLRLVRGEASAAAELLGRAVGLAEADLPSRLWLAKALVDLGRLPEATDQLAIALDLDPDFAAAHQVLAELAGVRGDHAAAAESFNRALSLQPHATQLHARLAATYRRLGKSDLAEQHLAQRGTGKVEIQDRLMYEIEIMNRSAKAHSDRGLALLQRGQPGPAAQAFRQSLQAAPGRLTARMNLGAALAQLGDIRGAIAQYRQVLEQAPEHATAHFNLGTMLAAAGDDEGARKHYRQALLIDPEHTDATFNLANALRREGAYGQALAHFERVIALDPGNVVAHLGAGRCLVRLRRFAAALECLQGAEQAFGRDHRVIDELARFLATCPDQQFRDGARALGLAQRNFAAKRTLNHVETLAMAAAEVGDFAAAVQWQQRAIKVAERAGDDQLAADLGEVLTGYQNGKPCRRTRPSRNQ